MNQGGKLMLHTRATTLLQDASGAIIGAAAEGADCDYVINAQSVILATGSYSHNQSCSRRTSLGGWATTPPPPSARTARALKWLWPWAA